MANNYKDLIFTNHALNRMKERSIQQHTIWQVLQHPDVTRPEDKANTARFIRTIDDRNYHVVATYLPDKKKSLVISAWVRGEEDKLPLIWQILAFVIRNIWRLIQWLGRLLVKLLKK